MSSIPVLPVLSLLQGALSAYSLRESYSTIQTLSQYEDVSKKAAKWSGTAEHELHKTRTTMTSSALAVVLSLLSASSLLYPSAKLTSGFRPLCICVGNVATTYAARVHVAGHWKGKSKVPLVDGFNKGVEQSKGVMDLLAYLSVGWVGLALVSAVVGR